MKQRARFVSVLF